MDVLTAATIFHKCAQVAADGASPSQAQLLGLSNKLNDPNAVADPNQTIDTALLATLKQEVDKMDPETQDPENKYPITRAESKGAANVLMGAGRQFHIDLTQTAGLDKLESDISKVRSEWDNYRRSYLSEQFLNNLQQDKGNSPVENQQEFEDRWQFWKELIDQIEGTVGAIQEIVKDQRTGNAEVPLEPEPL